MTTTDTKSDSARSLYTQQRMLFMTLDPVHIGAGGYRLGRVDMTIAREPGTSLPKIPGTSLAGAARSYAAMRYGKPDVAGQHKNYAGSRITCPIIYTFGTATDTSPSGSVNQAGTVSIGDAHILFFPVHSMAGPVWVSTVDKVRDVWGQNSVTLPQEPTDDTVVTSMNWDKELNLGWLLFTATKGLTITPPKSTDEWSAIADRIVLVTPKLFSQVVNSNLEVRTSVSIDPKTGAADSGALFTYEAIPRTTWLWSDVVEDDYRTNGNGASAFPQTGKQCKIEQNEKGEKLYKDNEGPSLGERWNQPLDVVKAGMKLIQYLGVGGMGTRGFGRMRLVTDWKVKANDEES
jgi:CRISPR-associated protein Cmr4